MTTSCGQILLKSDKPHINGSYKLLSVKETKKSKLLNSWRNRHYILFASDLLFEIHLIFSLEALG